MGFRELTIIDVKEVLRRWAAGQSARQMARQGVVSRRTATRYIEAATSLGLVPGDELTDERVRGVAQCVQARPLPAVSDPRQLLESRRIRIEIHQQSLIMAPQGDWSGMVLGGTCLAPLERMRPGTHPGLQSLAACTALTTLRELLLNPEHRARTRIVPLPTFRRIPTYQENA